MVQIAVNHKDDTINCLHKQTEKLQNKYTESISEVAVLKSRLKTVGHKKLVKSWLNISDSWVLTASRLSSTVIKKRGGSTCITSILTTTTAGISRSR